MLREDSVFVAFSPISPCLLLFFGRKWPLGKYFQLFLKKKCEMLAWLKKMYYFCIVKQERQILQ